MKQATAKAVKAFGSRAPETEAPTMDVDSILAKYGNAAGGSSGSAGAPVEAESTDDEPGLVESGLRGIKQGLSAGFGDEISGALESAFSSKTYKQARDEARAKDKAAEEAHPWGFGLGQIIGGVGMGAVTGGAAGIAAKAGTAGVAALAGAEGALQGVGNSEAEDVGGIAKDAAIGGAAGAALGAAGNKLFGKYADTAVERHAKHIAEDVTEGANMVNKRRFAKVQELAADVFDNDKELRASLKDPAKALDVVDDRLSHYGPKTAPIYQKIDAAYRPMTIGEVSAPIEEQISKLAAEPGKETIASALQRVNDNFKAAASRNRVWAGTEDSMPVPTQLVRKWASNLLNEADHTMGSIAETERYKIKDQLHGVADKILKGHIDEAAKAVPELKPDVAELTDLNKKIRVLLSAKETLGVRATKESVGHTGLVGTLKKFAPAGAGLAAASGDLMTGGATYLAAKGTAAGGRALNRAATTALATLAKAARSGNATKALAEEALRAGVPTATVSGILAGVSAVPEEIRGIPGELASGD